MSTEKQTSPCVCGFPDGRKACQELFNEVALRVREMAWTGSLQTWRLMHDVYSIQHEEEFCGRYRGLIMHLGGVCWALEHNASERGYRALQKFIELDSYKGEPYPPAPGIPHDRGQFSVAVLRDLDSAPLLVSGVDKWARAAWVAYKPLHPVARTWVQQALEQ